MKSTLTDSQCSLSTCTRMVRNNDASGRLRPRVDFYLWFFGQIHAKRLIIWVQLLILMASLYGFYYTSDPHFVGLPIPGFDGKKELFGSWGSSLNNGNDIVVDTSSDLFLGNRNPRSSTAESVFRKKIVSSLSYFYFFSIIMTAAGLRLVDKFWWNCPQGIYRYLNPGLFLVPCLMSILTFSCPLSILTIRRFRNYVTQNCFISAVSCHWNIYREIATYVIIPFLFAWCAYAYVLYGCVLGFVYVWRRARGSWVKKETAAASFSWSFRDKNSILGRLGNTAFLQNKSFGKANNNSWRSTKSTDRPTLRSYKTRLDLNDSQVSMSSVESDIPNTSTEFCAIDIDDDFRRGDFISHRPSIRRPLATVLEEGESQENSLGSDSSRL